MGTYFIKRCHPPNMYIQLGGYLVELFKKFNCHLRDELGHIEWLVQIKFELNYEQSTYFCRRRYI